MLVTHESHMVLAGPSEFVYEALTGFMFELRMDFRQSLFEAKPGYPDSSNLASLIEQERWHTRDRQYAELLTG